MGSEMCIRDRRTQILYLLFVVPLIQIGDAAVTMYSYSVCHCLVCHFNSVAEYRAWVVALYAFSVGRLSAMPLVSKLAGYQEWVDALLTDLAIAESVARENAEWAAREAAA